MICNCIIFFLIDDSFRLVRELYGSLLTLSCSNYAPNHKQLIKDQGGNFYTRISFYTYTSQ